MFSYMFSTKAFRNLSVHWSQQAEPRMFTKFYLGNLKIKFRLIIIV